MDLRERRVRKKEGLVRMRKDKVDSPACVLCLKSTHCLRKVAFTIRVIFSHTKNARVI
jgi:hypothetical protein